MSKKLGVTLAVVYGGLVVLGGPFWFFTIPAMFAEKLREQREKIA